MDIVQYRTRNGLADYLFSVERCDDGSCRACFDGRRSSDPKAGRSEIKHINNESLHAYLGRFPSSSTIEYTLQLAAQWADETEEYIRSLSSANGHNNEYREGNERHQGHLNPEKELPPLVMTEDVLEQIRWTVGNKPAETGGALGGSREDFVVRHFYFDGSAHRSGATYSPDYQRLNKLFKEDWNPREINLLGIVHSHPRGIWHPSPGDEIYAASILAGIPELRALLLPIVRTYPDTGEFDIFPFAALRAKQGVRIARLALVIEPRKKVQRVVKSTFAQQNTEQASKEEGDSPAIELRRHMPNVEGADNNSNPDIANWQRAVSSGADASSTSEHSDAGGNSDLASEATSDSVTDVQPRSSSDSAAATRQATTQESNSVPDEDKSKSAFDISTEKIPIYGALLFSVPLLLWAKIRWTNTRSSYNRMRRTGGRGFGGRK